MQIFGQVWLWSLGSFLLGVLFTWLLLVRPARKRVVELEDTALSSPRPTRVGSPVGEPSDQAGPNRTDRFLDDLFEHQRPPHLPPPVIAPPIVAQPAMAPPMMPPAPAMAMPAPSAPPEPPLPDESDTELSDAPFQQFTQSTTVFVPPTNLPQPPEVAGGGGEDWFSKEDEADPHAITDVEDDEQVDDRGTIFTQHTTPIPADMIRSLDESQPEQAEPVEQPAQFEQASQFDPQTDFQFDSQADSQFDESAHAEQSRQPAQFDQSPQPSAQFDESSDFAQSRQSSHHADAAEYEEAPQSAGQFDESSQFADAPQPSQFAEVAQYEPASQSSEFEQSSQFADVPPESAAEVTQHFEPAQVEHFEPAPQSFEPPHQAEDQHFESAEQFEPAQQYQPVHVGGHQAEQFEAPPESGRSLFEPVVPVGEREEAPSDEFIPPGPFGPGSAMPLPGGGAPAPEFNVKASVTALRYCTQDNPQFDRIVAEVWFRTPSDAERVGFRVLS
jgi:hypothetical protein